MANVLHPGDLAPDFEAEAVFPVEGGDPKHERLRLQDFRGKKNVVLYFYPGDFTPVCTKEACGFRDMYDDLKGKDTEVVGVSIDSSASHERFAKQFGLSFPLIADPEKKLAKQFGATGVLTSLLGRVSRVTFVIGKDGKIAAILKGELSANKHVEGVKNALAKLG